MEKKSSKEYSVVFLVEGEELNLGEKIRRQSSGEKFKFAASVLFELGRHTNTFCQEKHQHFHAARQLVTKKEIITKINLKNDKERSWPSGLISDFVRRRPGFDSQRGWEFFSFVFSFFFFNLTT